MREGPTGCQDAEGVVVRAAAFFALGLTRRALGLLLVSAAAALPIASANGLADGLLGPRAFLVGPYVGRAALVTANLVTTSSLSLGSRSPRYANNRCSTLPPGNLLDFFRCVLR